MRAIIELLYLLPFMTRPSASPWRLYFWVLLTQFSHKTDNLMAV